MNTRVGRIAIGVCLLGWLAGPAWATAPVIFSQPAYQSPVRADPDDLLILAGDGFAATDTVVYQRLTNTSAALVTPSSVPGSSTNLTGTADIVSFANEPNALSIRLPTALDVGRSYALWVRNQAGEWSNGVRINDARPLWVTPDYTYATQTVAALPRELKVVGRNLLPQSGSTTQVRLTGPTTYTLTAVASGAGTTIDRYAARVQLPASMTVGTYTVSVTRDGGTSWVPLNDQTFAVKANPALGPLFSVFDYALGSDRPCSGDDVKDDTPCILAAIADAKAAGGGDVFFPQGTWYMDNSGPGTGNPNGLSYDGVLVPPGVNLVGSGRFNTTIVRGQSWPLTMPNFTLRGHNKVSAIRFADDRWYLSTDAGVGPILRLGVVYYRAKLYNANDPTDVTDVTITDNEFDKPFVGVADGGLPIDHLFVTYNEFGAFNTGFFLNGNSGNTTYPFHFNESVIAHNVFKPGSYFAPPMQGTIASQIGAGRRVDFSENIADGRSTQYLYSAGGPKGWRAAFFWHMNDNQEKMLVSQNQAYCTGDLAGDGEAFSYDNNHNTFALGTPQAVASATSNTVTVNAPLVARPTANYYVGHWVHVVQGRGLGQARKIVSYTVDPSGSPVTLTVSPAWDVVPQTSGSQIFVGRTFWQVMTVDNQVDQSTAAGCAKANAYRPKGGLIALYSQTTDSVVEGNEQQEGDGILLAHQLTPVTTGQYQSIFQYFTEVRGNTIDGEYRYSSDCSMSGINLGYGTTPDIPPPVAGFGETISHNFVTAADGLRGGAIGITRGWFAGPPPNNWKFIDGAVVFHNVIKDITLPIATVDGCDGSATKRSGIHFQDELVWRTTLYGNSCTNVSTKLDDGGQDTRKFCPAPVLSDSCECP